MDDIGGDDRARARRRVAGWIVANQDASAGYPRRGRRLRFVTMPECVLLIWLGSLGGKRHFF